MDDDATMRASREPMNIDQLKRHMDRRLRLKADEADVRRLERKMDLRFESIDGKLNAVQKLLMSHRDHHRMVRDDHEQRLCDLERPPTKLH